MPRPLRLVWPLLLAVAAALPGCFAEKRHEGERLYAQHCAGCHGEQGQGLERLIPPLAGADYLALHRDSLPCLLRRGRRGPLVVNGVLYNQVMPGNDALSPARLTNLLNYVESHWGNRPGPAGPRTIGQTERLLQSCPPRP